MDLRDRFVNRPGSRCESPGHLSLGQLLLDGSHNHGRAQR